MVGSVRRLGFRGVGRSGVWDLGFEASRLRSVRRERVGEIVGSDLMGERQEIKRACSGILLSFLFVAAGEKEREWASQRRSDAKKATDI